jgi:enterochelin esterase-like enzyme
MKRFFFKPLLIFILTSTMYPIATAQNRWQPVISPEVNPDKTITFRLWMPDAREVKVGVQFEKEQQSMAKNDSGIWSVTIGPVKPDIYPYSFFVDGVQIMDPNNRLYFPNERFMSSLVDIRGDTPLIHSLQDVPHGIVSYRYYNSKTLNTIRQLVIYTPPGYEQNTAKNYPVLYLIHGMTDTEETWFKVGHANLILDNLIAQGKAEPMIIVMPYANIFPDLNPNTIIDWETHLRTDLLSKEITDDVIPFIEENYRVLADKEHRAIAGFSLGGRQTLAIGMANPDLFSWVCAYAPAVWKNELESNFSTLYAKTEMLNQLKLLSVSCGTDDFLYNSTLDFIEALKEKKINHKSFLPDGGHTWMNCKLFLTESAQLIFR